MSANFLRLEDNFFIEGEKNCQSSTCKLTTPNCFDSRDIREFGSVSYLFSCVLVKTTEIINAKNFQGMSKVDN